MSLHKASFPGIPDVALIAYDALLSADAKSVAVVAPFQHQRLIIKQALRRLLPDWKVQAGMPPRCSYKASAAGLSGSWYSVTPLRSVQADLVLRDTGRPAWEQEALRFVATCEPHGCGPCREAYGDSRPPWTSDEFLEWFNTIAHTTAWPRVRSVQPGVPTFDQP